MTYSIDLIAIGARIKTLRQNQGLSQEKLAELINLSPTFVSNIETGRGTMSLDTLVQISNALHASTDEILFGHPLYGNDRFKDTYVNLLIDCNSLEKEIILDNALALKDILKKKDIK